uniref:Uncharacterized protein n=1 Tax=Timema poppense TaxID=170557 RepID=A0A7R9DBR5_TIMPO|nr:unnamed protein product [Timema poppensis]
MLDWPADDGKIGVRIPIGSSKVGFSRADTGNKTTWGKKRWSERADVCLGNKLRVLHLPLKDTIDRSQARGIRVKLERL